jgi:uncharacterized protein YjbI with pentapeptide repeats
MASEEHLAILRGGVERWNQWRLSNIDVIPNLSQADLRNKFLGRADLSGTDFTGADLTSSDFYKANIAGADLREARLSGAKFNRANLSDANFSGANLSNVFFNEANFSGAILSDAILTGIDLSGFDLSKTDLSRANLSGTILSGACLSGTILSGAYLNKACLSGSDLTKANLIGVDLSEFDLTELNLGEANLKEANLKFANLTRTQALGTNLTAAMLTGACIEDWHINSATNLDNVICDYIYLKNNQQERRPSSGNFAPGEFSKLFQKALETVDLIFADGIDWKAFFESFQQLQAEYGKDTLSVQAFEKKRGNAFVVRLEVLPEANKAEIEFRIKELYEVKLRTIEEIYRYQLQAKDEQINIYREQSASIMSLAREMAARPIQNIIDVTAYSESESMSQGKKESNFNLQGAQFGGGLVNADTVNAHQIGGNITNNAQEQPAETKNPDAKTILILAANPRGTSTLRLDEEVREIDAGLQRAKKRELFDLKQRWAVRVQEVYQSLLDFKPQIVHFSGHGTGDDGLVLEDETGKMQLVDTVALTQLFELFATNVECVVLNACYSEVQAKAIAQHIPYVIGMNKAIGDKAAIKFATGFYSALGAGESVEFAYKLGCNVIQLDGIPEHLTPILKKK